MLRISKLTDYSVVVLTRLAEAGGVQTSSSVALACGVPEPTVAKVLKLLAAGGLVESSRGARGGYRVVAPLSHIAISDVIRAVDGPIALTACVEGSSQTCETSCACAMRGRWDPVNRAVEAALEAITLGDMRRFTVASPLAARNSEPSSARVAESSSISQPTPSTRPRVTAPAR